MKLVYGNLWEKVDNYDGICITTNGARNKYGQCIMGRGVALDFKRYFPEGPKILGDKIVKNGNIFQPIMWNEAITFYAFPTKHVWVQNSDPVLIRESAIALGELAKANPNKKYLLPRPGCSNGGLKWENVKEVIEDVLPDNVHVIDFKEEL